MTFEELKKAADDLGCDVVRRITSDILPHHEVKPNLWYVDGINRRTGKIEHGFQYKCQVCGFASDVCETETQAMKNWNKKVRAEYLI